MRSVLALLVVSVSWASFAASPSRSIGPFQVGMTAKAFRAVAAQIGLVVPRFAAPVEHDIMGLGLMTVQPLLAESREAHPVPGQIWSVLGYVLAERVVMLQVDWGLEDGERTRRWYEDHDVSADVRKHVCDTTWATGGVVFHADRFGSVLSAVDWGGLRQSNRVLVDLDGAVRVANDYFRRQRSHEAEASLELIQQRVFDLFKRAENGARLCKLPPSVDLTPAETPCELPEKRFAAGSDTWGNPAWRALGIGARDVSRYFSYSIESDGESSSARVILTARGDQDCNGEVSTMKVILRSVPQSMEGQCTLDEGQWEVINPLE